MERDEFEENVDALGEEVVEEMLDVFGFPPCAKGYVGKVVDTFRQVAADVVTFPFTEEAGDEIHREAVAALESYLRGITPGDLWQLFIDIEGWMWNHRPSGRTMSQDAAMVLIDVSEYIFERLEHRVFPRL